MSIEDNVFTAIHTEINQTTLENETVLRVVKKDKQMFFDENTYAKLVDSSFHNGEIEVKLLSRLLPDAPDFVRGFAGLAFRINEDDTAFESFYVRPTNGRIADPIRKKRAIQYFSYPTYTFDFFRNQNITDFEGSADIGLDEWITLKAVIHDARAVFYINNREEPVLIVDEMKLDAETRGSIGLFVDIGTEAFFKELKITHED